MTTAETPAETYVRHRRELAESLLKRCVPVTLERALKDAVTTAYEAGYEDGRRSARVSEPER